MTYNKTGDTITQANESTQAITAVASATNGITVTIAGHGYSDGDYGRIAGTTDYNGRRWFISNTTTNTFDIVDQGIVFTSSQTGTFARGNKDLSDLSGVSGVTVYSWGSGDQAYAIYDVGDTTVEIDGSQFIDASKERLVGQNTTTGQGTLVDFTASGDLYARGYIAYVNGNSVQPPICIESSIQSDNLGGGAYATVRCDTAGATCKFEAVAVKTGSGNRFQTVGCDIDGLTCILSDTTPGTGQQIHLWEDFPITNLTIFGHAPSISFDIIEINGLSPQNGFTGLNATSSSANAADRLYRIINYGPTNMDYDVANYGNNSGKGWLLVDSFKGSGNTFYRANTAGGLTEMRQRANTNITDEVTKLPIENAVVVYPDYDNGNQADWYGYDYTQDLTDPVLSDANGDAPTTPTYGHLVAVQYDIPASTPIDRRSKNDDDTDVFDIPVWAYGYQYAGLGNVSFKGRLGIAQLETAARADIYITESSRSAVQAYPTLNSGAEIYDSHMDWKATVSNYAYPTAKTQYINGAGTSIAFGAMDLVQNSGAASARDVNTAGDGTFTAKSSDIGPDDTFTTGFTFTTGTLTVSSGDEFSARLSGNFTLLGTAILSGATVVGAGQAGVSPGMDNVTGSISLEGASGNKAAWTVAALTAGLSNNAPDLSINAYSTLVISDTTAWNVLDLRGKAIAAGAEIEVASGQTVIVLRNTGEQAPNFTGAGTGSVLTGINADAEVVKNGSTYEFYAPVNLTINDSGSSPIATAVVRFQDSGNNNRTFNDSKVAVDALTTNGSGVATGFSLFRTETIGGSANDYSTQTLYAGKVGYNRLSLAQSQDGMEIGGSQILGTDSFYTATPANNLTIDFSAETLTAAGNDTTQGWYDYGQQQWLSATNIHLDQSIMPAGADFAIGEDYDLTINFGNITGANIQVGSGETLDINGASTLVAATIQGGVATSYNDVAVSTLTVNNNNFTFEDLTNGSVVGSGGATGRIIISGASTSQTLDLRSFAVTSGFTVENTSGVAVTIRQNPGQTNPTLVPTSGTLTIDQTYKLTMDQLSDGDTVWLQNVTLASTLDTVIVSGGLGYEYSVTSEVGDSGRLIVQRKGKLQLTIDFVFPAGDINYDNTLEEDIVYTAIGVDGATVTGVTFMVGGSPNLSADGFDLDPTPSSSTTMQNIYAYQSYYRGTLAGIVQREEWVDPIASTTINYKWPDDMYVWNGKAAPVSPDTLVGANHKKDSSGSISDDCQLEVQYGLAFTATDIANQIDTIEEQLTDIEGTEDHNNLMRGIAAVLLGKASGGPENSVFRDINDTKDRVSSTADSNGDRSAMTLDLT